MVWFFYLAVFIVECRQSFEKETENDNLKHIYMKPKNIIHTEKTVFHFHHLDIILSKKIETGKLHSLVFFLRSEVLVSERQYTISKKANE